MFAGTRNEVDGAGSFLFGRSRDSAAARVCPYCGEELSNGFAFCPLDGTPLGINANKKAPEKKVRGVHPQRVAEREGVRLTVIEHRVLIVRLFAALTEAIRSRPREERLAGQSTLPSLKARAAGGTDAQAGERPGEMRFAMMEDSGLLRRLTEELGAFARDSRLTWPEFRRDPAGFVRRAFDALDRLGLIPFSRRYKTTP